MLKPNVATCLNSSCDAKFKRMGDGKLFVEPLRNLERGQEPDASCGCAPNAHVSTRYTMTMDAASSF